VSAPHLGGARVHERNGVCHSVVEDDAAAVQHVVRLLSYLPQHAGAAAPSAVAASPEPGDPGDVIPAGSRAVYDVRDVMARIVDAGSTLELQPKWARNLVCALARVQGRAVGVIANQPRHLGGVLDAESAQKGARFVRTCNAFNLPLLVLVDTPGFMPGSAQEHAGVIRHGAKLLHAFAEAEVPKVTIVLRKAFGGACITMSSRDLGGDFTFAWPRAELGIMGSSMAVGIVHRRRLEASADPDGDRLRLAEEYAEQHLRADAAARVGYVDEVIASASTRDRVAAALGCLTAVERDRRATNIPL